MPRCALVGAVDFNAEHFCGERFDLVIAVDGGYRSLASIGRHPDLVVGDFDSLGFVPEGNDVLRFPVEKDASDMELALQGAIRGGCDELVFYGALSQRLDHTLANIQLMVGCARRGLRMFGIGPDFCLAVLDADGQSTLSFDAFDETLLPKAAYGDFISVFSYGGTAKGVCEVGLKYPLDQAAVRDDVSLGLSNEFTGAASCVSVAEGTLIVTFPSAAWVYLK
jgi:thiamine pyrophosphokinase